jgi:hypothetical protein
MHAFASVGHVAQGSGVGHGKFNHSTEIAKSVVYSTQTLLADGFFVSSILFLLPFYWHSDIGGLEGLAVLRCMEQTLGYHYFACYYDSRRGRFVPTNMSRISLKLDFSFGCRIMLDIFAYQTRTRGLGVCPPPVDYGNIFVDFCYKCHLQRYVTSLRLVSISCKRNFPQHSLFTGYGEVNG